MQVIRKGDHHYVARWHGRDHLTIQIGVRQVRIASGIRICAEFLPGKGVADGLGARERCESASMLGAHRNLVHQSKPLQLIKRRQDLIVYDHPSADNSYLHCVSKASSRTAVLSRIAASVITKAGAIFTVAPPKPTGVNIKTPFSKQRRTTSHARLASGAVVPGVTHASPATSPLPCALPISGKRA